MKKGNTKIADKTVGKEYQVPELIDLNNISGAQATPGFTCSNGSAAGSSCSTGVGVTPG
ncbi:MAG: hypothetical protein HXX14_15490 [Bacteroidetes bacterium]|nr:hypothetical protein [Bacteroidota bacterium]